MARALLDDNQKQISYFIKILQFILDRGLRSLFVNILIYSDVADLLTLWNLFKANIYNNLLYRLRNQRILKGLDNLYLDYGLYFIAQSLDSYGKTLIDFRLPESVHDQEPYQNRFINKEINYDIAEEQRLRNINIVQLNIGQKYAFNIIVSNIEMDPITAYFFLYRLTRTGKIFLYITLYYYYRTLGKIIFYVVFSGVTALLLLGNKTSHTTFKIPIDIHEVSTCYIPK